jgi:hypothetical protein
MFSMTYNGLPGSFRSPFTSPNAHATDSKARDYSLAQEIRVPPQNLWVSAFGKERGSASRPDPVKGDVDQHKTPKRERTGCDSRVL